MLRDDNSAFESMPDIGCSVLINEPMSSHTSYKIGGPADAYAVPEDVSHLQALLQWAYDRSVPVFILGGGTNLLVSDRGIRGLVIQLGTGFGQVHVESTILTAGASARLAKVVRAALGRGLCGLEGLAGVPGTVGGAVYMNAGTPVGCIGDSLESITAVDIAGRLSAIPAVELGLRYRGSNVREKGLIVTEAVFNLRHESSSDKDSIVEALLAKRKHTQPMGTGTAGSVFKNPPDGYAGQLLEAVGAKGMQIGGARVSGKHANFIENTGAAAAEDVRALMTELQRLVMERFGVALEPEVQLIGEWQ